MKKKKESYFKGKVRASTKKQERSGGTKVLKLPKGISLLIFDDKVKSVQMDLMPYIINDPKHPDKDLGAKVGFPWYRRPYKLHRSIGAKNKSYICRSSIGAKCPICEHQTELFKTDKDAAVKLYPQDRDIYAPIPLNSKKHEAEPIFVWDMAEKMFNDELDDALEKEPEMEIFPDLDEGKTLECDLKWKSIGDGKPFPEVKHVSFEDRDPYDESIMEDIPNLDDIIKDSVLSYEDLKAAYFEMEDEEDGGELEDDDDEDEKPKRHKKLTSTRRKVEKEDAEEEDDDDDEDDDTPRNKKQVSKKSTKKIVDDEDKDDDEDPDEEDIKTKSKKTSASSKSTGTKRSTRRDEEDDDDDDEPEIKLTKAASKVDEEDRCVACKGSGKNSKGNTCPICKGTGVKPESDDDDDEDEVEEKSSKKSPMKRGGSSGDAKCPHGHKFGKDSEKFDECDDCKIWNACADAKEKLGKK